MLKFPTLIAVNIIAFCLFVKENVLKLLYIAVFNRVTVACNGTKLYLC